MEKLKIDPSEKDLMKQVSEWLTLMRIFFWRNNTGAIKTERGGFYHFGYKGSPDYICIIKGLFIGIELKGPNGEQSDSQKEFEKRLSKAGGIYILARSLNEIIQILRNLNLIK